MKKVLSFGLVAIITMGLVACGGKKDDTESVQKTAVSSETIAKKDDLKTDSETIETEATSEAKTEEETASVGGYTYTDMDPITMYTTETVNVRDLPDTSGQKLTSVRGGTGLIVFGKCNETGWYRVEYANDKVGYVSNSYVSTEKPVTSSQSAGNSSSETASHASNGGGSANSGTTLEENIAFAESMGYSTTGVTWISDTDYDMYRVFNKLGYGCTVPPDPDRPVNAIIDYSSAVDVYDDANMVVTRYTCHCY